MSRHPNVGVTPVAVMSAHPNVAWARGNWNDHTRRWRRTNPDYRLSLCRAKR
jgi:hypothetical protein